MAKKVVQTQIPGTERPKIVQIEKAAERYVTVRDERMALTEKEVAAKAVLIQAMHDHKQTVYIYDETKVELSPSEKVKVKRITTESDD